MSGFLDANEIEKLFERASEGNLPVDADSRPGRRARWLRTVDFTRPDEVHDRPGAADPPRAWTPSPSASATRLVAEHRTAIELEVIDVGQFTWTNAFAQLPDHSVHIQIDTAPHEARMLLSAELPVVLVALERMLGGRPETASRDRELTDIDLMVVQPAVRHDRRGALLGLVRRLRDDAGGLRGRHPGRDGPGRLRLGADARR